MSTVAVKERPILFSGEMVRAILDGRKTQTRRVIKPGINQKWLSQEDLNKKIKRFAPSKDSWWTMAVGEYREIEHCGHKMDGGHIGSVKCPHGKSGDQIYVKETHYLYGRWVKNGFSKTGKQKWRFDIHSSRKVAYVDDPPQVVSSPNTRDEWGWFKRPAIFMPRWASRIQLEVVNIRVERVRSISMSDVFAEGCKLSTDKNDLGDFQNLWDSINAKRGFGWDVNPWVWVIEFKRIAP